MMGSEYRKREKTTRDNRVNIRLTDAEYARVLKMANRSGLTPTGWAAEVVIGASTPNKK